MHALKSAILSIFYTLIFIYLFKYETVVRSSALSFGDSDPDPSSVILNQSIFYRKYEKMQKEAFTSGTKVKPKFYVEKTTKYSMA